MKSLLATMLFIGVPIVSAQGWATSLRMEAQAMRDDIARNSPGPVDPENPGFTAKNDQGLTLALQRASRTTTYMGYLYALIAYAATFNDGHLAVFVPEGIKAPPLPPRWPGFSSRLMRRTSNAS